MGVIYDTRAFTDQARLDEQAIMLNEREYNTDGSAKAKDLCHYLSAPLQSDWPPGLARLTASGHFGHFSVRRDTLTQVAHQMGADLTALRNTLNTLNTLNGGGAGGATLADYPTWPTAEALGINAGQAYFGISTYCKTLNDVYDQVIGYLVWTVTNYADADTTAAVAANNVGTDFAPSSLSGGRGAGTGALVCPGDGSRWQAITGDIYKITTMQVEGVSAGGMTASEIEFLLSNLNPLAVEQAGDTHTKASRTLLSTAHSLVAHAQALADGWSGTAAQASIAAFAQLHTTALNLANASAQTGRVLTWLGGTILPYYQGWKAPSNGILGDVGSLFGHNPQDEHAQQVMHRLNDRLTMANQNLPPHVTISLPKLSGQLAHAPAVPGGGGPGRWAGPAPAGLTSAVRAATSPVSSAGGVIGVHPGGRGVVPTGPAGRAVPSAHLAGLAPGGGTPPGAGSVPGGTGGVPSGSGLSGGTAPGGFGIFPGAPGAGVGGNALGSPGAVGEDAGFLPGEGAVVGSDGMIGTGPGIAEGEFGPGNTGVTGFVGADDAATQMGDEFPATGGSGGGRRENERYRQAWMAEDVDTWEGEAAPSRR